MRRYLSHYTHEHDEHAGHLWYFAPTGRKSPPYLKRREVRAIIDIADDGTLAGVELIDDMPPPPKQQFASFAEEWPPNKDEKPTNEV